MRLFSNERRIEAAIIILFLACMLFTRLGQQMDYRINHDYPESFKANDNFFHSMIPEEIKESGGYAYLPTHITAGYEDVVAYLPPFLYHASAMFSSLTSVETYDCTFIIAMVLFCSGCLLFYFVIKKTDKDLALLSLPFMIGIFSFTFEIAFEWGLWLLITGMVYLVAVVWSMAEMGQKYSFMLFGVFLSALAIAHFSEMIFLIGFIVFYYVLLFFKNSKMTKIEFKKVLAGLAIFFILSFYYIIIAYSTYAQVDTLVFTNVEVPNFAPNYGVNFNSFGFNQLLLFVGIVIFFGMIFYEKEIKNVLPEIKLPSIAFIFGIFMLVVGFTNYLGFNRAFQTRILWPVYLSVFMGMCIYFSIGFLKKWRYHLAVIISLILIVFFASTYIGKVSSGGMITKGVWDGFTWLGENTETNSKVLHFYNPTISQDLSLFSTKRVPYKIDIEDYVNSLRNQVIKNDYSAHLVYFPDMKLPYRKTLFSYGFHAYEEDFKKMEILSMWDMNYYFIKFNGSDPEPNLIIYNAYVAQYLINHTWIQPVYGNGEVVILKNNEPGRKP